MPIKKKNLEDLKNVGKATLRDLHILGIHSVADLIHHDATQLFEQLEKKTGKRHDFCMWDVFAAIIGRHDHGTRRPGHECPFAIQWRLPSLHTREG